MEIGLIISYNIQPTSWSIPMWVIEDASVVEAFDIVDIDDDSVTLRFKNNPDITSNFDIYEDPFDTLIVAHLEWQTGKFVVGEGSNLFNKVIKQRHIPFGAQLLEMWVFSDDLNKLMSISNSIAMVRKEHHNLVTVKYDDWDVGMKVLEKMYRAACE